MTDIREPYEQGLENDPKPTGHNTDHAREAMTAAPSPSGHDTGDGQEQAVEIVARTIQPLGHHLMCDHANPCNCHFQQARDKAGRVVAHLTTAGLLATEQEWGVRYAGSEWLDCDDEQHARKVAAAWSDTDSHLCSRGVTSWREQA